MTETTTKRPRGTWRRRILVFLLAAILLLLLIRSGLDFWAGRRINAEVARLEQKYGSLDPATLTVPAVPEGENRARAMRAATALIAGRYEVQAAISAFLRLQAPAPVPVDLRGFVEANQAALRVADDARARHRSNWEADYPTGGNSPPWMQTRSLSDAIYLAARIELEEGRPDGAATTIATGLALSASVRQEPSLLAQLIRITLGFQHFEAIQQLLTGAEPSKASLEELANWLAENRAPDPIHLGLLSEVKHINGAMARVEGGLDLAPEAAAPLVPSALAHLGLTRPLVRLSRVRYLETMGQLLDLQAGARPRPSAALPQERWSFLTPPFHITGVALERTIDTGDTFNGQLAVTELAVALRRHRLDHGQYPEALSALVPAYLTALPIDPVTGKPPVYVRDGSGFRLSAEKGRNVSPQMALLLEWTVPK